MREITLFDNYRPTSATSYAEHIDSGKQSTQLILYIEALRELGTASDREVSIRINMYPSQVSARRNEALKNNLIEEAGTKRDERTGKTVTTWRIK